MSAIERNVMKIKHNEDDVTTTLQSLPEDEEQNYNNTATITNTFNTEQRPENELHHRLEEPVEIQNNATESESKFGHRLADTNNDFHQQKFDSFNEKRRCNAASKRSSFKLDFSSSLASARKPSLVLEEQPDPYQDQMTEKLQVDSESRKSQTNLLDGQIMNVSQNQVGLPYEYFTENPLSTEAESASNIIDRYVTEQQRFSEARLFENNEDNYYMEDYNQQKTQSNKQYKRRKRKKKHKINPSHQLNTISSIQVKIK